MSGRDAMIVTDIALSEEQRRALETLVGMMIPASDEYAVPGANDATIFADILATAKPHLTALTDGLKALDAMSTTRHSERFAALDGESMLQVVEQFSRSRATYVRLLVSITAQCYYRDDRVMEALGMEARSPHPEGFTVEEGDWSLLDPVRQRPKFYRETP